MPIFEDLKLRIQKVQAAGNEHPLVVFDVDDTLIDCRYRKSLVFRDFANQAEVQSKWPEECRILLELGWERLTYRVADNLGKMGIAEGAFGNALFDYWMKHYFTYPYLIQDRAFPGAQAFVAKCVELGAHIVYLTARDHPGMYQGTIEALESLRFPMHSPKTHVMLKPEVSMSDHHFKVGALDQIASLGRVVASLENELINLNAMAEKWPDAAMYWRKTLYAPDPPPPHPRVEVMLQFP
jgi:predicted secreted acid phosphatase